MTDILPSTLPELANYIVRNFDRIAVREQIDGKWGSYYLSELSLEKAADHVQRFLESTMIPYLVKEKSS